MATGGHRRGDWEIHVTPPYRGQGVGDGDFRLWIEGGQQVNIRDTNDVYVEMQDGETYAVWVANRFRATVEVDLNIDGRFLGSFLLDGNRALRIERPKDVAKKFTFFTARGSVSDSNHELGMIRCLFKPRCRKIVVKVKGQTRNIFAPESYTVLDLKKHIDRLEHIAPHQQNLWYIKGAISLRLEDEKMLSSYGIEENSFIECRPVEYMRHVYQLRPQGLTMCGPDVHWTRGSTRLTGVSDQTFPKRVDNDAEYDASAGEELMIKLVGKDTYSHSEPLENNLKF